MGRRSFWHSTYLGNFVKTITYSSMKTRPTHKNIYYVNVPFPAFHSGLKQKQKKKLVDKNKNKKTCWLSGNKWSHSWLEVSKCKILVRKKCRWNIEGLDDLGSNLSSKWSQMISNFRKLCVCQVNLSCSCFKYIKMCESEILPVKYDLNITCDLRPKIQ